MAGKDAIFAEWFTGELCIPMGELLEYIHMGFDTLYEQEIILTLEQGVVRKTDEIKPISISVETQ